MRQGIAACLFLTFALAAGVLASPVITGEQAFRLGLYMPQPAYPFEARARHLSGSGRFLVHIRVRSGLVRQIDIVKSTGSSVLDAATLASLKRWRFKPGALPTIEAMRLPRPYPHPTEDSLIMVPINFSMEH